MEVYKHKKEKKWFVFTPEYKHFIIAEDGMCLANFKEYDYNRLEEYEIIFDQDIDYILNNIDKLAYKCDACICLKGCLKKYKFTEEKEQIIDYLKQLKKTKRIGEFAE